MDKHTVAEPKYQAERPFDEETREIVDRIKALRDRRKNIDASDPTKLQPLRVEANAILGQLGLSIINPNEETLRIFLNYDFSLYDKELTYEVIVDIFKSILCS